MQREKGGCEKERREKDLAANQGKNRDYLLLLAARSHASTEKRRRESAKEGKTRGDSFLFREGPCRGACHETRTEGGKNS